MPKISKFIKQKLHLYDNGKFFDVVTPEIYIDYLCDAIILKQLPENTQNKTSYRRTNPYTVAAIVKKEILEQLKSKTILLDPYKNSTPRNKLLHWGVLFDILFYFYTNSSSENTSRQQYIKQTEYQQMPKRFRSALKKTAKGYIVEKEPNAKKYKLIFDNSYSDKELFELMKNARKLIQSIYPYSASAHDFINSGSYGTEKHLDHRATRVAMPSDARKIDQYFITDGELESIQKLKDIFYEIQKMFLCFEHKSNGQDTVYEYNDAKRRQNVVREAQAVSRTAQQYLVSVKKAATKYLDRRAIINAEQALKTTKAQVLYGLHKQISTRIK